MIAESLAAPRREAKLTWITGVPKSGTTALYASVTRANPSAASFLEPASKEYPAIGRVSGSGALDVVVKTVLGADPPAPWLLNAPTILVALRDPRDVVVSWLPFRAVANPRSFALTDLRQDLMEAFRRKAEGDPEIDVTMIEALYRRHGSRVLEPREYAAAYDTLDAVHSRPTARLIRFEDFVAGRAEGIKAVALSGDIARNHRGGRTGEWKKWFSLRDINRFRGAFDPLLLRYGYPGWEGYGTGGAIVGDEYEGYLRRVEAERRALYAQAAALKARFAPGAKRLFGGLKSPVAYQDPTYVEKLLERASSGRLGAIREVAGATAKGWLTPTAEIDRLVLVHTLAEPDRTEVAGEPT